MSWELELERESVFKDPQGPTKYDQENVCFKTRDTKNLETLTSRTNQFVNDLMHRQVIRTWGSVARREVFKWAGWAARLLAFGS